MVLGSQNRAIGHHRPDINIGHEDAKSLGCQADDGVHKQIFSTNLRQDCKASTLKKSFPTSREFPVKLMLKDCQAQASIGLQHALTPASDVADAWRRSGMQVFQHSAESIGWEHLVDWEHLSSQIVDKG